MNVTASAAARAVVLVSVLALVAGCGLPRSGPTKREIASGAADHKGNAFVVEVDNRVARMTAMQPSFGFSEGFQNAGLVGSDAIASGDTLAVTVFENVQDDPLLGNTGQRVTSLERVQVDGQGYIYMPYAGRIRAAGQTPEGLRQTITRRLETQTPDPQITVQRVAGDGTSVTVSGAVVGQGVYPIEQPTRTLSAMISKAGGVSIDPEATIVRVTRGNQTSRVRLLDLYENPTTDIALRAGDRIIVEEDTRAFTALGATGVQNRIPFETESLSAIEAIATVGGLRTTVADPKGVFVFRDETEEIARAVLGRNDLVGDQRIVYILDLTAPTGIFEARDFQIRDGDTVYVTEAPYVMWQKTLAAITGTTGAADRLTTAVDGG